MLQIARDVDPPLLLAATNITLCSLQSCALKLLTLHFWITKYNLTQCYVAGEYRQAAAYKQ